MYSCSDGPDFDPPPSPVTQRGVTCVRNISPPVQRQDASPCTISKSGVPMRSSAEALRRAARRSEPSIEGAFRFCATDPVSSSLRMIQRELDEKNRLMEMVDPPELRELRRREHLMDLVDPPALRELRRLEHLMNLIDPPALRALR